MTKVKTYKEQFKAQIARITYDKSKKWYIWGSDNKLPNNLIRAISDSGTATNCVARLKTFIQGKGFADETAKSFKVNPKETANDMLSNISPSMGVFEAVFFRVLFRLDGEIGSVYELNPKTIRPMEDGYWRYNRLLGEALYKQTEDVILRPYSDNASPVDRQKIITADLKSYGYQVGEILAIFQKKLVHFGDVVPIPDCYSGLEDIETDAALQRLDRRTAKKGFKASTIIALPYEIDRETKDVDTQMTDGDVFDKEIKRFTEESDDDGSMVVILESKSPDSKPVVTSFPVADILDGTEKSRNRIPRAVCRHFSVPPVLLGMEVASVLGNTQAVVNSMKMFLTIVSDRQEMISRAFKRLWPALDWTITKANIFEWLPPEVSATLTDDEKRQLGGYAPRENKLTDEQKTTLINLNSLPPHVSVAIMATMSEEEIRGLAGLKGPKPTTSNPPPNG